MMPGLQSMDFDKGQKLEYAVLTIGGKSSVVFTGITSWRANAEGIQSTDQAATEIVKAIAARESLDPFAPDFYDLQAPLGYAWRSTGRVCLYRLSLFGDINGYRVIAWSSTPTSQEVREMFARHIAVEQKGDLATLTK